MARDRKRAKQRRDRRGGADAGRDAARRAASDQQQPVHADIPAAVEHAGEVDEFDAALIRGAGGVPADVVPADGPPAGTGSEEGIDTDDDTEVLSEREIETEAETEGDLSPDERQRLAADGGAHLATPEQASGAPTPRSGNRVLAFLRASWAELQRVQWPDRRQVFQATAVVLGFVVIAGAYLGLADLVAKEIVEVIL